MERIFDGWAFLFYGGAAVVAFGFGALCGAFKGHVLKRAGEAAALAFLGSFIARTFISILLSAADDSRGAGTAIAWAFFLWPGVLDLFARMGGANLLTAPHELLWFAATVGAFAGMMDGMWRIHRWRGHGWASFPLDVTWGLIGTTNAALLHLVNFSWGQHQEDLVGGRRPGTHRYKGGFRLKGTYAFTQGSVMSNLDKGPTDGLYKHETLHAWQSRAFGPFFTLSYVGWMLLMAIPGMIAAGARGRSIGGGLQGWTYYSNPWEAWAYSIQGVNRENWEHQGYAVLSDGAVIGLTIPYALGVTAAAVAIIAAVFA